MLSTRRIRTPAINGVLRSYGRNRRCYTHMDPRVSLYSSRLAICLKCLSSRRHLERLEHTRSGFAVRESINRPRTRQTFVPIVEIVMSIGLMDPGQQVLFFLVSTASIST